MGADVPLWVEGRLVWIRGLTSRTTCADVIATVLKFKYAKEKQQECQKYRVIERWKSVERLLPNRCKIVRVWEAWADEKKNVRFIVRKRYSKGKNKSYFKRSKSVCGYSYYKKTIASKMHKVKLGYPRSYKSHIRRDFCDSDAEKLRRIIAAQREILSRQKHSLAGKDEEIDQYETMIHLMRVEEAGENYLQDAYLSNYDGDEEHILKYASENGAHRDLHEASELFDRILEISNRIEKQEDYIKILSAQIRHSISLKDTSSDSCLAKDEINWSFCETPGNDDNFDAYLYKTKIRIECLAALHKSQKLAIDHNERTLHEYNKILEHKLNYMKQLENDVEQVEKASMKIQQNYIIMENRHMERSFADLQGDAVNIDNNSDTGLSSLHSSSDDCGYVLNTLV